MLTCPNCKEMLDKKGGRLGLFWVCPSCQGRAMTLKMVKKAMQQSVGIVHVAVFAHLGGAAVGVLFWLWTRHSISTTN